MLILNSKYHFVTNYNERAPPSNAILNLHGPQFIFSLATLIMAGKYLERVWGQNGFLLFVAVVVVASNVIAVGTNVLEHFVFQDSGLLL